MPGIKFSSNTNSGSQHGAAVFFRVAAEQIISRHKDELPDLRRVTVVVPNYHAANSLARELAFVAGMPALLLPQMVTFNDWAKSVQLPQEAVPDTTRLAVMYQALRDGAWFEGADLWGIARELLDLQDELTLHHVTLPPDESDFLAQLEQAYQAQRNSAMQMEARLVHELWYAMQASGEMDAARAYQYQLATLAQQACTPLTVLLTSDLSSIENRFLEAYAERQEVQVLDIREMAADMDSAALLQAALGEAMTQNASLLQQATALAVYKSAAVLRDQVKVCSCHGLEQEAQVADLQIRRWLLDGKRNIALVAQDRLVARRVRALLERASILVQDETGWTFSTMAVSTVLMRWLDVLQDDFYYQDLLDFLKSPYLFSEIGVEDRKLRIYRLEQLIRQHGVVSGLKQYRELAMRWSPELLPMLQQLEGAREALTARTSTLAGWQEKLLLSLDRLGVLPALRQDGAGEKLLQALQYWQQELAQDGTRFSMREWKRWLMLQLDGLTWRDTGIESPVVITHLAATRWRRFDAVLMLGCDAEHLPAEGKQSLWFNDAVRAVLGLPVREVALRQQRHDLLALLLMNDTVLITSQGSRDGEDNLPSPFVEVLCAMHQMAFGDDLIDRELPALAGRYGVASPASLLPEKTCMPSPVLDAAHVQVKVSAAAYNSLVACPYQYFARQVLRLNELDEVQEGMDKRDFGEWVHAILHRFHQRYPLLTGCDHTELNRALHDISVEIFDAELRHNYWARAWLLRWHAAIPAYLDAQLQRESEGWRYQQGELEFEKPLDQWVTLRGRIDRVDVQDVDGEIRRVLDYKLQAESGLKSKLRDAGEDVQLPVYAHAVAADAAAYLSMEKDKVAEVVPPQQLPWLVEANISRLKLLFEQMRSGTSLPANGNEAACLHCEMQGLCRKAEWERA